MKWLRVENEIVEERPSVTVGSETWAAAVPCGVIVRHVLVIGRDNDEALLTESMLYIHGGHVHDLGNGLGKLVGA